MTLLSWNGWLLQNSKVVNRYCAKQRIKLLYVVTSTQPSSFWDPVHFQGLLHFWCRLRFWGRLHFWCHLHFWGRFHFKGCFYLIWWDVFILRVQGNFCSISIFSCDEQLKKWWCHQFCLSVCVSVCSLFEFGDVSRMFQGCFDGVAKVLLRCFMNV